MGQEDGETPKRINKSLFLTAAACPTAAWYAVNEPSQSPTAGELMRMLEGQDVGKRAWSLFAGGVSIKSVDLADAVSQTRKLMDDPKVSYIFEAAFEYQGYVAKADVLARHPEGWRVIEVKSSLHNEEEVSPEHIDDLAYTTQVVIRSGVKLASAELVRLSRDWRLGQSNEELFGTIDCTDEVLARGQDFAEKFLTTHGLTFGTERPNPTLTYQCRECPHFEEPCVGKGFAHTVFEIPRLGEKKFQQLADDGILNLTDVPDDFPLSDKQSRVIKAARTGQAIFNAAAVRSALSQIRWPAFYLDFETVKSAVPLWADVAPHEQVVTQYSLHICQSPGEVLRHHEFLADAARDCRLELTEALLRDLAGEGSIVVYSSFEKTTLNGLARRFPALEPHLMACVDRLFDFERVFDAYYHPGFCGRTSIKKTLPVLVPDMSYKDLSIGDGDTAVAKFASMARGECSDAEQDAIRADLLKYCGQDTFAMVRLHAQLHSLSLENSQ